MDNNYGCKDYLSMTATLVGIFVSLVTILKYFFPDGNAFLAAVGEFWSSTFPGNTWPGVGDVLSQANNAISGFAQSSPFTPWWTAILIFIIGGIVKYAIESEYFYSGFDLKEIPLWGLPALLWIFVFYATAGFLGIIVFVVGYIVSSIGLNLVLDLL